MTLDIANLNMHVLISTPDDRPHLLKSHFSDAKVVISQEGFLLLLPYPYSFMPRRSNEHQWIDDVSTDMADHHKNGTNCLPAWHACVRVGVLTVQPNCLKGRVVCGTVCRHALIDLLGSLVRVGYCIPVPDFYLVLHGLCGQIKIKTL